MRPRRALHLLVVLVVLAAAGWASPAAAAERTVSPPRTEPHLERFSCTTDPAHLISVTWYGDAYRGAVNWVPEGFVAPVGAPWTVEYAEGIVRLTAQGQYLPLPGQPFRRGTMTLTAAVAELHPTVTRSGTGSGSGDSNDQQVHLEVVRALEVVGTAHVEFDNGHTAEVAGCRGSVVTRTMDRTSDPRAGVARGAFAGAWCDPLHQGDRFESLWIDVSADVWSLELSWYDDGGTPDDPDDDTAAFYINADPVLTEHVVGGAAIELSGSTLAGDPTSATVTFDWSDLATSQSTLWSGTWTQRSTVTSGPLAGDIAYDDGVAVELDCFAYSGDYRRIDVGGGSPPTAHPPANDVPEGAVPLVGASSTQTSGTAAEAEEPNPCAEPWDGQPDYRATHTVWFTVTGSGPTIVDTTGTRFDTAIAVYTRDDTGGLAPVDGACNDDWYQSIAPGLRSLTLQARATFDAAAGTTYLVQVGGVSSDANYGALQVDVTSP